MYSVYSRLHQPQGSQFSGYHYSNRPGTIKLNGNVHILCTCVGKQKKTTALVRMSSEVSFETGSHLASLGDLPVGIPHFIPDHLHSIVRVHCQKSCINTRDIARHLGGERGGKTGHPRVAALTSPISYPGHKGEGKREEDEDRALRAWWVFSLEI